MILDYLGGPKCYHKGHYKREAEGNVRTAKTEGVVKMEDAELLALNMEEKAKSQEMRL